MNAVLITTNEQQYLDVVLFISCHSAFNPLNSDLNPICHLLALLGAHHILHVSRIRVKLHIYHPKVSEV